MLSLNHQRVLTALPSPPSPIWDTLHWQLISSVFTHFVSVCIKWLEKVWWQNDWWSSTASPDSLCPCMSLNENKNSSLKKKESVMFQKSRYELAAYTCQTDSPLLQIKLSSSDWWVKGCRSVHTNKLSSCYYNLFDAVWPAEVRTRRTLCGPLTTPHFSHSLCIQYVLVCN